MQKWLIERILDNSVGKNLKVYLNNLILIFSSLILQYPFFLSASLYSFLGLAHGYKKQSCSEKRAQDQKVKCEECERKLHSC